MDSTQAVQLLTGLRNEHAGYAEALTVALASLDATIIVVNTEMKDKLDIANATIAEKNNAIGTLQAKVEELQAILDVVPSPAAPI